jgi:hypothetical protein
VRTGEVVSWEVVNMIGICTSSYEPMMTAMIMLRRTKNTMRKKLPSQHGRSAPIHVLTSTC